MTALNKYDLAFAVTRLPKRVADLLKREGPKLFIAGGYLRSIVANETINDIDIFTDDKASAKRFAKELLDTNFHDKLVESPNAITLVTKPYVIQFITRWTFNRPEEVLPSFDYTIAKAALWYENKEWKSSVDDNFYVDLAARRLVYTSPQRNEDAGGSIIRMLKFYQKGYRITLQSLAAVVARLNTGIKDPRAFEFESRMATLLTGLLVEVDPHSADSYIIRTEAEAKGEQDA